MHQRGNTGTRKGPQPRWISQTTFAIESHQTYPDLAHSRVRKLLEKLSRLEPGTWGNLPEHIPPLKTNAEPFFRISPPARLRLAPPPTLRRPCWDISFLYAYTGNSMKIVIKICAEFSNNNQKFDPFTL